MTRRYTTAVFSSQSPEFLQIAREREVKAQIKMLFKAVNGKSVVSTRSLQLTQQSGGKQQYKNLENAIKSYGANDEVPSMLSTPPTCSSSPPESQPEPPLHRYRQGDPRADGRFEGHSRECCICHISRAALHWRNV